MNALAPPFVWRDNILSSPSVQWTVSCICVTPRISISVNTRDNLDNCRRDAMKISMRVGGWGGVRCLLCSFSTGCGSNFEGAECETLRHISTVTAISLQSFTLLFALTADFCLPWIGGQPGFLSGTSLNKMQMWWITVYFYHMMV